MRRRNFWWWLILTVVLWSTGIRLWAWFVDVVPLWGDEAQWVKWLVHDRAYFAHRSPGYLALLQGLTSLFGLNEVALRAPSFFPSALFVPLLALLVFRMTRSGAAALFAAYVAAASRPLLWYAQETKPYSLEMALHAIFLLLTLRAWAAREKEGEKAWTWLLVLFPVSLLFAYNLIFLAIPVYALAWHAARRNDWLRLKPRILTSAGLGIALLLVFLIATFQTSGHRLQPEYWGAKYNVFYLGEGPQGPLEWFFRRGGGLLNWPLSLRGFWEKKMEFLPPWGTVLCFLGLTLLVVRRQRAMLFLFLAPLVLMIVANVLGKWPWGEFRTNLFCFAYLLPVMAVSFSVRGLRFSRPVAGILVLLLIGTTLKKVYNDKKVTPALDAGQRIAVQTAERLRWRHPSDRELTILAPWSALNVLYFYAALRSETSYLKPERVRAHTCLPEDEADPRMFRKRCTEMAKEYPSGNLLVLEERYDTGEYHVSYR